MIEKVSAKNDETLKMHRSAISKLRGRHYASVSASAANKSGSNTDSVVNRSDLAMQRPSSDGATLGRHDDEREMQLILSISDRLETGLNEHALQAIVELLQRGIHPDAIVGVVTSLAQRPGPV